MLQFQLPIQEAGPLYPSDAVSSSTSSTGDSYTEEERFQLIQRLEEQMAPVIEEPSSDPAYEVQPPQNMSDVSNYFTPY